MSLALVLAALALLQAPLLTAQGPTPADSDRYALRQSGVAVSGLPGLVMIPAAASLPSGLVDLSLNSARTPRAFANLGTQRNGFITLGFLPRVTIALRGTVMVDTVRRFEHRDLSDNVQVLLLTEGERRPALAVGAFDAFGAADPFFRTSYAVATKTVVERLRFTLGYGTGPQFIKGLFGGVEVHLAPWASAMGEFDSRDVNGGLRVFPFPASADRAGLQPKVDLIWRQGTGFAAGVGLRTSLGEPRERRRDTWRALPGRAPESRAAGHVGVPSLATAAVAAARPAPDLQAALVAEGFENVRALVALRGGAPTLDVNYENRRYNRDELDALGVVLASALRHAPEDVRRLRVTIRRENLAIITIESDLDALRAFVDARATDAEFASQLEIASPSRGDAPRGATRAAAPSHWKLDVFLRPRLEYAVLSDISTFESRTTLFGDAWLQLAPGVVLNARRNVAVTQSTYYPSYAKDPDGDRLLLHATMPVPGLDRFTSGRALTQFSAGRFTPNDVGVANEVDFPLAGGRVSLGGTVGLLGRSASELDRVFATAVGRLRYSPLDVTASLTVGRFFNGDDGYLAELSRLFGNTEFAFFLRSTNFASAAGIRLALPLAPRRELPPMPVRPRLPDLHSQQLQAAVFVEPPFNVIRKDIALPLPTDHEIARAYRNRDRLNEVTIREHVDVIQRRARAWLAAHASR